MQLVPRPNVQRDDMSASSRVALRAGNENSRHASVLMDQAEESLVGVQSLAASRAGGGEHNVQVVARDRCEKQTETEIKATKPE